MQAGFRGGGCLGNQQRENHTSFRSRVGLRPASGPRLCSPLLASFLVLAAAGCGGAQTTSDTAPPTRTTASGARTRPAATRRLIRRIHAYPVVRMGAITQPGEQFVPVVLLRGKAAAWLAQRSGVTLVRFNALLVHLALHSGSLDPGGGGWSYGDRVGEAELHHLVAAFNGGFRLNTGSGGFRAQGRTPVALQGGTGSVVTYTDGSTQIGAWQAGVPTIGKGIASVRQNLRLLIAGGVAAPTVNSCALRCWGATLGGGISVPRSALGVSASGDLVYAAGSRLSPAQLADTMAGAGVQQAVELDINPQWVAAYLYGHRAATSPAAIPLIPGQTGIAGFFLKPYSRDFFTIVAR